MNLPITSIQTQPSPPIQSEDVNAAKKLKDAQKPNPMSLPRPNIGVIEPPRDEYKFSISQKIQENQNRMNEINSAAPLAASSLEGNRRSPFGGFFGKLLITAGIVAGSFMALKKFKLSSVSTGEISSLDGLKNHLTELLNLTKKGKIKPFNLKEASVRVSGESADKIKTIMLSTRQLAYETKNIKGKAPKITVDFVNDDKELQKIVKQAIKDNTVDKLPDSALNKIDYINLAYKKSNPGVAEILLDTKGAKFVENQSQPKNAFSEKIKNFFKDFLSD